MFLHLGGNIVIPGHKIIAILDARSAESPATKEFMEIAKDEGFIKNITPMEKAKSFVITSDSIYVSPISCTTLKKRSHAFCERAK